MEAKTQRKKRSLVWRHFTRLKDEETGDYIDLAKCSHCEPPKLVGCHSGTTTNLKRHLINVHGIGRNPKRAGASTSGTEAVTVIKNETGSADGNNVEAASGIQIKNELVENNDDEGEAGPSRPESESCANVVFGSSRPRPRMSKAWKYFKVCRSSKEMAKCKLCSKFIRCSSGATSGLLRHFDRHHRDVEGGLRRSSCDYDTDFEREETDDESYLTLKKFDEDDDGNVKVKVKRMKTRTNPRPRRALAWKYFKISKRNVDFVKCKLCNQFMKNRGGGTSSLRRHLLGAHKIQLESVFENDLESLAVQVEETDDEPEESDSEAEGDSKEVEGQRQNEGVHVKSEPTFEPDEMEEDDYFNDAWPASPSESEPSSPHSPKSLTNVGSTPKCWDYFVRDESKNRAVCKLCLKSFKVNENLERKLKVHARNFHHIKILQTGYLSQAMPPIRKSVPCFICFGREKGNGPEKEDPKFGGHNSFEDSVLVMFALTKIVGVDSSDLQTFLKRSGGRNPNEWVKLCGSCKTLVSEAYQLDKKIQVLAKTTIGRMKETQAEALAQEKFFDAREFFVTKEVRRILSKRLMSRSSIKPVTPVQTWVEEVHFGDVSDGYERSFDEAPREMSGTSLKQKVKVTPSPQEPAAFTSSSSESNSYFSCPTCPRLEAMEFNKFLQHLIFHWKRPRKCSKCGAHLPQKEELIQHHWQVFHPSIIDSFLGPKSVEAPLDDVGNVWQCGTCDTRFPCYEERDDHERREHQSDIALDTACTECPLKFRSVDEVRLHKALAHPAHASLNCFYCDETFSYSTTDGTRTRDLDEVKVHIRSQHMHQSKNTYLKQVIEQMTPSPVVIMRDCPLCGKIFKEAAFSKLTLHLEREHSVRDPAKVFPCPICSKEISLWNQWYHLRALHGQPSVCDLCGAEMKTLALPTHKYKVHGVIPEGSKLYKCEKGGGCNYETLTSRLLKLHYRNFHSDKTKKHYACQFCGKRFHTLSSLNQHESIHSNAKTRPFKCDLCGAGFAVGTYLYIHKRTTHERRYFPSTLKRRKSVRSGCLWRSQARAVQGNVKSQIENVPFTSSSAPPHIDPLRGSADEDRAVARLQDSGGTKEEIGFRQRDDFQVPGQANYGTW